MQNYIQNQYEDNDKRFTAYYDGTVMVEDLLKDRTGYYYNNMSQERVAEVLNEIRHESQRAGLIQSITSASGAALLALTSVTSYRNLKSTEVILGIASIVAAICLNDYRIDCKYRENELKSMQLKRK